MSCCSKRVEYYDPDKPVCDNQADFNVALRKAVLDARKQELKKAGNWVYVWVALWALFLIWAVMLAMKKEGKGKTVNLTLALVFSPAYVLAHYLGK